MGAVIFKQCFIGKFETADLWCTPNVAVKIWLDKECIHLRCP